MGGHAKPPMQQMLDKIETEMVETERHPAMEVHLGRVWDDPINVRYCIIWIDGRRWEGSLVAYEERQKR